MEQGGVRIAELVATLSYAADLGLGQPMEHCLRQTVIALRIADLVGADQADREATYYLGLLVNSYCHADASEQARWFGDDISMKADSYDMLVMSTPQMVAQLLRSIGSHGSAKDRARRLATRLRAIGEEGGAHSLASTTVLFVADGSHREMNLSGMGRRRRRNRVESWLEPSQHLDELDGRELDRIG